MKILLALILPMSVFASTFSEKYHGTYKGTFKESMSSKSKACTLKVSLSHTDILGGVDVNYHNFDFTFESNDLEIDGYQADNEIIDNHVSERWFMADFPHRTFEFTKYFGNKKYLVTALKFKRKELRSAQVYIRGTRAGAGGIFGPGSRGINCKNLKKTTK